MEQPDGSYLIDDTENEEMFGGQPDRIATPEDIDKIFDKGTSEEEEAS